MPRIGPPLAAALCDTLTNGRGRLYDAFYAPEASTRIDSIRYLGSLRLTRKKMGILQKREASPDRLVWRARIIELIIHRVYLL